LKDIKLEKEHRT